MQDPARRKYIEALRLGKIVRPTLNHIMALCPHLTKEQVMMNVLGEDDVIIALPPIRVRGCVRGGLYRHPPSGGKPFWNSVLGPPSYKGQYDHEAPFFDEALAFAEERWPDDLIDKTWVDCVVVELLDPGDGRPSVVAEAFLCIDRPEHVLLSDSQRGGMPLWSWWDVAISYISLEQAERAEVAPDRLQISRLVSCARCGGYWDEYQPHDCEISYIRPVSTRSLILPPSWFRYFATMVMCLPVTLPGSISSARTGAFGLRSWPDLSHQVN